MVLRSTGGRPLVGLAAVAVIGTLVVSRIPARAFTVPVGAPTSHLGDAWPTPLRTLWVDRCGRGDASVCGSVACSDANPGTSRNAPLCTLGKAGDLAQPGDLINVRAGWSASDGYWEPDRYRQKIGRAALAPSAKGTATCAGGARVGWGCTSDASCPDSWCDYRPIVLKAYAADGVPVHIDPAGRHPPDFGADQCWSQTGNYGRYVGLGFGPGSCSPPEAGGVRNERLECYGGTREGKPCSGKGDCGAGAVACASRPWYWVVDGFQFTGWNYYDARLDINNGNGTTNGAQCSEKAVEISGPGFGGCPVPVSITLQNNTFARNGGGGVVWGYQAAGMRYFNNRIVNNYTRGYTTVVNHWAPRDAERNRRTYMWGNVIGESYDDPPPWAHAGSIPGRKICRPANAANPPTLTCIGGDTPGAACREETDCGWGHCGGLCLYMPFYNTAPANQGYNCECKSEWIDGDGDPVVPVSMCAPGLTCVAQRNTGGGGDASGNSEGRGIIIDSGDTEAAFDLRNNVIYHNAGDCIAVFRSDGGNATMGSGVIANNTCYHNAKKGAAFGELNFLGRYLDVFNNLIVPLPQGTCKSGRAGGRACTTYGQLGGVCGVESFGCSAGMFHQFDNVAMRALYAPDAPETVRNGHDLFFLNLPGFVTNPLGFEFAAPGHGEVRNARMDAYLAYGAQYGLWRGTNSITGDPLFVSTDPQNANFLKLATGSPAVRAGNPAYAPPFDRAGTPRDPLAPTIGAYEGPAGPPGPTTTTTTTTTTTIALPPEGACGEPSRITRVRRFRLRPTATGHALRVKTRLSATDTVDLGASGLGVILADDTGQALLQAKVSGTDLTATRGGWSLATSIPRVDALDIRAGAVTTMVTLDASLPWFPLVTAAGAPDVTGLLHWRVGLGTRCSYAFTLACTESPNGRRRCRRE